MKKMLVVMVGICALVLGAQGKDKGKATMSGPEQLMKMEADFNQAAAEHGLDGFMSYFAEDGVSVQNGGGIVTGKAAIRESLSPWGPDLSLTWKPVKAEMAASGDLGYTFGNYVLKAKDKNGKMATQYGKYATVWKKQKDGSWKVAMDMGNGSPAPAE